MTTRITADEARKLAGPTVIDELDKVYLLIRKAALRGEFYIWVNSSFWWQEHSDLRRVACNLLYADGFGTDFHKVFPNVTESSTKISW